MDRDRSMRDTRDMRDMESMGDNDIKQVYEKIITRKYACALLYDRMAITAYAINALGLKRILMEMSKENWKDYVCLWCKVIPVHEIIIYPDLDYTKRLLDSVEQVSVSPLSIDSKIFIDRIKKLMKDIKRYEKETQDIICEELEKIQHYYPEDFRKITKTMKAQTHWLKKLGKMEMMYDKLDFKPEFVMQDQKRIHDLIKEKKY